MTEKPICAITHTSPEQQATTLAWAKQLGLPILNEQVQPTFLLECTPNYLQLRHLQEKNFKPIHVDFLNGPLVRRQQRSSTQNETLARAIGLKPKNKLHVLDATAGLGRDSFLLASLGCTVQSLERALPIAALLADGLTRLKTHPLWQDRHFELTITDATTYLQQEKHLGLFDVIYLDPMFPQRHSSALVKKEMRILRDLVGDDPDATTLFNAAYHAARQRVVVKRHSLDPLISDRKPNHQLIGKTNRFDIYITT